jgi:hypothetical protein
MQGSLRAVSERGEIRLGRAHPRQDRIGMPQEQTAGFGELHTPAAARALDEPLAGDVLEGGHVLAHGRGRKIQPVGGTPEAPSLCDGLEHGQMPYLESPDKVSHADLFAKSIQLQLIMTGSILELMGATAVVTGFGIGIALGGAPGPVQAVLLSESTRGLSRGFRALAGANLTCSSSPRPPASATCL